MFYILSLHLSQICSSHPSFINHWLISKMYWDSDLGLYDGHSSVLHGSIWIISTIFKSESNRIHASGIKVFFIQNEWIQLSSKIKSIQSSSDRDSLYISQSWRNSGVSAISKLKHVLLQQIFGFSVSHASYLKMRKDAIKIRMKKVIQIVILYDFFIYGIKCKYFVFLFERSWRVATEDFKCEMCRNPLG